MTSQMPDLRILIRRQAEAGSTYFTFQVWQRDLPGLEELGSARFETGGAIQQEFRSVLNEVSGLAKNPEAVVIAEHRLASIGTALFRQLPAKLQDRLWSLQEHAKTLQLYSDESAIPWELAKLQRRGPGGWENGPFLCEAFAVTRWLLNLEEILSLPVRCLALVIPASS